MAIRTGKGMISYTIDTAEDIITPARFNITKIFWKNVRETDEVVIREYIEDVEKDAMPYLPLLQTSIKTTGLTPANGSVRYLIDYAASTTITGNVVTLFGVWG